MNTYLKEKMRFNIVPSDVSQMTTMEILSARDNEIDFINSEFPVNFVFPQDLEFFSNVKDGILYFKSQMISFEKGKLKVLFPNHYDILQRRESERVVLNVPIDIISSASKSPKSSKANVVDLSVGGMKISMNKQLKINEEYSTTLNFDNLDITLRFVPSRISFENDMFYASGRLLTDKASDKIELVQYCYKKQFEQANR